MSGTFKESKNLVKACVIHLFTRSLHIEKLPRRSLDACLEEAVGLAKAIHLDIVYQHIIQINKAVPSTLLGKGNVDDFAALIASKEIQLVVIDASLTPVQQRNLERSWKCKVIDRTGLILEIFGERARTAEGRLQVELASLTYQRSRLVRSWTHLERQRGGFGFTGGPGESQLELDRRLIDDRITKIKKQLEQATRTRGLHRKARQDVPYPTVALVGYTNAGKSTLFNQLTKANVFAEDLLFATLDPTMRHIKLPSGRQVILSDTVGFISNLPTQLIASFRATLEEVCSADIILHVQDASHTDTLHQAADVKKILTELGLEEALQDGTILDVYNKIDLLSSSQKEALKNQIARQESAIGLSAITAEGIPQLCHLIDQHLNRYRLYTTFVLPACAGDALAWLYRNGAIVEREDFDDSIHLQIQITPQDLKKFQKLYGFYLKKTFYFEDKNH